MKIAASHLKQIIKEELQKKIHEDNAQSWSEIIIDRSVSALLSAIPRQFDPPEETLHMLETRLRVLLSDDELVSMLNDITGANR